MNISRYIILWVSFAAMAILAGCSHAPETKDNANGRALGIVYGKKHAFTISAPKGWVLDNASGVNQGLHAVFYPEGSSWESSGTVMYANGYDKQNAQDTLDNFMEGDAKSFMNAEPNMEIEDAETRNLNSGTAHIRHFFGGNYEAVAYIDTEGAVITIVMSSRTKEGFMMNYRAFLELLDSYLFLTNKVEMD